MSHELERLYRARYEHFVSVAAAITGDVETAHDAVQTAFAQAVRKRRTFRREGPLEAWVWRIVVNAARRSVRARAAAPIPLLAPPSANGSDPVDVDLREWLAALPERQRHAVFLRYYADLDYRTIAAVLGVRVGTVSATLNAAHAALRRAAGEVTP